MTDDVGIDVAVKVSHIMTDALGARLTYPGWMARLGDDDRLGAKVGKGFYRYEKGKRTEPDPAVYEVLGQEPSLKPSEAGRFPDRTVLPMVNEAARCLEEGIVASAGELDLAMILGTGFPPFRGGLCHWADSQGLEALGTEMERWAAKLGERFLPSEAFLRASEAGGFYKLWA